MGVHEIGCVGYQQPCRDAGDPGRPPVGRGASGGYGRGHTWSHFTSEHLVDYRLTPDLRNDQIETYGLKGTWPVLKDPSLRLFSSLGYTWSHTYSNQNHYDAQQFFFNPDYYSYIQQALTNNWTLAVGENPWTLGLTWSLTRQHYSDRLTQDPTGTYGSDVTFVNGAFTTLELPTRSPKASGWTRRDNSAGTIPTIQTIRCTSITTTRRPIFLGLLMRINGSEQRKAKSWQRAAVISSLFTLGFSLPFKAWRGHRQQSRHIRRLCFQHDHQLDVDEHGDRI